MLAPHRLPPALLQLSLDTLAHSTGHIARVSRTAGLVALASSSLTHRRGFASTPSAAFPRSFVPGESYEPRQQPKVHDEELPTPMMPPSLLLDLSSRADDAPAYSPTAVSGEELLRQLAAKKPAASAPSTGRRTPRARDRVEYQSPVANRQSDVVVAPREQKDVATLFIELGVRPVVAAALEREFPQIRAPTMLQQELIKAILAGRDLIVKEDTGQGKTFALLLALLSVPRPSTSRPTSVFLVPSATLALQILEWATLLIPSNHLPSTLGLLLRPSTPEAPTVTQQISDLVATPPHILLATPAALDAALDDRRCRRLVAYAPTLALDEADAVVRFPHELNRFDPEVAKLRPSKLQRIVEKHAERPTTGVSVVRALFAIQAAAPLLPGQEVKRKPHVVLASATFPPHFTYCASELERWVRPPGTLGGALQLPPPPPSEALTRKSTKPSFVGPSHHVVVVSPLSEVRDIHAAPFDPVAPPAPKLLRKGVPSPAPGKHVLEGIARLLILAGDKTRSLRKTLVVLPDGAPTEQVVQEMRRIGLSAEQVQSAPMEEDEEKTQLEKWAAKRGTPPPPVNWKRMQERDQGKQPTFMPPVEGDHVLLATSSFVRGLDLPELSAVYILSGAVKTVDDYIHLSGRVGRLGTPTDEAGRQRVITLVEGDEAESKAMRKERNTRDQIKKKAAEEERERQREMRMREIGAQKKEKEKTKGGVQTAKEGEEPKLTTPKEDLVVTRLVEGVKEEDSPLAWEREEPQVDIELKRLQELMNSEIAKTGVRLERIVLE